MVLNNLLHHYCIGLFILIIAIILNLLAQKLKLLTWYEFGPEFFKNPLKKIKNTNLKSLLWLFILYPFILGYLTVIFGIWFLVKF